MHECLKWKLKFNSESLFLCQSRQIFEVRAIERHHHKFQPTKMPPHFIWPCYYSNGLSPVCIGFEIFSEQICNVKVLICHSYKNHLTRVQFCSLGMLIYFGQALFFTGTIRLHQMRKDLVLCAQDICVCGG